MAVTSVFGLTERLQPGREPLLVRCQILLKGPTTCLWYTMGLTNSQKPQIVTSETVYAKETVKSNKQVPRLSTPI